MIGLTSKKIAVDPIFYKGETEGGDRLSREEKEYLEKIGITPEEVAPSFKLTDDQIKKCNQGIVRYIGSAVKQEFELDIGDYVLFSGYTGTTVRLEGEGLLILMNADFVTAKLFPPETEIPGLFFQDNKGEFWPATHEMAIDMIRRTFEENGVLDVQASKPEQFIRGE